ncbi:MAG TPA: hypothetical protein VFV03_08030, partial [Solirubrobacteraceae bacterium]|nr:hypothetical protein [Solirubrobacteraceae bacterium]
MSKQRFTRTQLVAATLIVLIVAAGGIARGAAIGTNTHLSADESGYVANANRMLSGERYATFKWPPGTSFAFAVTTRLSGHHSLRLAMHARGPAQYTQLAIGVLALGLAAALAWLLAGPWAAVIATALVAGYAPLVVATRTYLSEPLGTLALLAAVAAAALAQRRLGTRTRTWLSWRLSARRELIALAGAGAVGGLACLVRGDLAVGMAVIAVALACAGRPGIRAGLLRGGVYLAALLLTLSPWLVYAS